MPQADTPFETALAAFVLEKALYEVCYEAANRPDWLGIPLGGIGRRLDAAPPPKKAGRQATPLERLNNALKRRVRAMRLQTPSTPGDDALGTQPATAA